MMKRNLVITVVLAIFFLFGIAQKGNSEIIAYGTVWYQTLVFDGGGDSWFWWSMPSFHVEEWEAQNVLINLEWLNPETGRWQLIADDRTNVHGHYVFDVPPPDTNLSDQFRIYVPGNQSEQFDWRIGYPAHEMAYYIWFF